MKLFVNKKSLIFPVTTPTVDLGQNIRKNWISFAFCLKIHVKLPPEFENYMFNIYLFLYFVVDCWKKSTDFGDYFWQVECFL